MAVTWCLIDREAPWALTAPPGAFGPCICFEGFVVVVVETSNYFSYILSSSRIFQWKRVYFKQEITYAAVSLLNSAIGPFFKAKMNCGILVIICPMFWNIPISLPEDLVHLCLLTIPSTIEKKIKNKETRMMDLSEGWYNYGVRFHCFILNFLYCIIHSFTTSFIKVQWEKSRVTIVYVN